MVWEEIPTILAEQADCLVDAKETRRSSTERRARNLSKRQSSVLLDREAAYMGQSAAESVASVRQSTTSHFGVDNRTLVEARQQRGGCSSRPKDSRYLGSAWMYSVLDVRQALFVGGNPCSVQLRVSRPATRCHRWCLPQRWTSAPRPPPLETVWLWKTFASNISWAFNVRTERRRRRQAEDPAARTLARRSRRARGVRL